ncbi:MAG: hypothetical protein KZQ59_04345 [Candidatus Thiodiazotropha sp. (ex Lucinoma aequizonata)]|nr:hypothetical protein [Candidatus Thiodiazotropha sp. (ex Lucinoma aequizonata)]
MPSTDRDTPLSDISDTQDGFGAGGLFDEGSSSDIFQLFDLNEVRPRETTASPSPSTPPTSPRRASHDSIPDAALPPPISLQPYSPAPIQPLTQPPSPRRGKTDGNDHIHGPSGTLVKKPQSRTHDYGKRLTIEKKQAIQPSQAGLAADIPQPTQGGPGTSQPNHFPQNFPGVVIPDAALPPPISPTSPKIWSIWSHPRSKRLTIKEKQAIQDAVRKEPDITLAELKRRFGHVAKTLSKQARLAGRKPKVRGKKTSQNIQKAGEMQKNGVSISEIVEALKVSQTTVNAYLSIYREGQAVQPSHAGGGADIPQPTQGELVSGQLNHSFQYLPGVVIPDAALPPPISLQPYSSSYSSTPIQPQS